MVRHQHLVPVAKLPDSTKVGFHSCDEDLRVLGGVTLERRKIIFFANDRGWCGKLGDGGNGRHLSSEMLHEGSANNFCEAGYIATQRKW